MKQHVIYAFRTLLGPWLIIPALGIEVMVFLLRGMPWRGEGMWTVEWFAVSLYIIGPLAAGAAAVDAARLTRPGNIHLVTAVHGQWRPLGRAVLWNAAPLAAIHLAVTAVGLLAGQVDKPSVGWLAMAAGALVQCLVIAWYAALGSVVGRAVSPALAGLLGAGLGFILSYAIGDAATGNSFQLLALGAATVSRIGLRYDSAYLAGQAAVLTLTSMLFVLASIRLHGRWKAPSASGALALLAAAGLIIASPMVLPAKRTVPVAGVEPQTCRGNAPQVCVYYEHRRFAPILDQRVRLLSDAAQAAGYDALVPRKVVENSRSYVGAGQGIRSIWLPTELYEQNTLAVEEVAYQLIQPSQCDGLHQETPPSAAYDNRFFSVLTTWLRIAHADTSAGFPVDVQPLSPAEVMDIMADFARCDLDGTG
ncbi:hypothetical protein AB0H43_13365 [Hamadaea sp. NPDC050747]|uniref:hypothetical protein n=1 Tax=Hamadaea sp. NPDC050747 TaxID=3155789 RepID=UPI0033C65BAB